MKAFTIHRAVSSRYGCFGVMAHEGLPVCITLEASYANDKGGWFTKIPAGRHVAKSARYEKGGYATYEIFVEGHDELKIHRGNFRRETNGCILVGLGLADGATPWISGSGAAFLEFMELAAGAGEVELVIYDPQG